MIKCAWEILERGVWRTFSDLSHALILLACNVWVGVCLKRYGKCSGMYKFEAYLMQLIRHGHPTR